MQSGESSFYSKRSPADSMIDISKTIIGKFFQKNRIPVSKKVRQPYLQDARQSKGIFRTPNHYEVFDRIRMLDADSYPPAFINIGQFKLEFSKASLKEESVIAEVKISQLKK